MKNKKHYVVIENPNKRMSWDSDYIIVPENEPYNEKKYYTGFNDKADAEADADRRNNTYYISDYAEDEIADFYNSLDFTVVEEAINEYFGQKITFKYERAGDRINFESNEDLCELFPAIGLLFAKCHINSFGGGIYVDKQTGELRCNLRPHFSYEHFDLGSNGCELAFCTFSGGKWSISFERNTWLKRKTNDKYWED